MKSVAHEHNHAAGVGTKRLWFAFCVTSTVLLAEIVGAALTSSLAVVVDLGHVLTDLLGLTMALVAANLTARTATNSRTWGWARAEVVAASVQALILVGVGIYAVVEAIRRLVDPPEIDGTGLLLVGIVGLVGNLASLFVLAGSRHDNLNLRAAFLEVLNDALGSVAVIVSAIVINTTGWHQADSVASLIIAALIVPRAFSILGSAGRILMEFAPKGLDLEEVRQHLLALDHVVDVHDMHASSIGTGQPVFSAHIILSDECYAQGHGLEVLEEAEKCLRDHHGVALTHTTLQLEPAGFRHAKEEVLHR